MGRYQDHKEKYLRFKKDAENETLFVPTRIDAYFNAMFHLIEAIASLNQVHVDVHQKLRKVLENNPDVFGEETELVWTNFIKLERDIRPGQVYGRPINGEKLKEAQKAVSLIEGACLKELK